VGVGKGSFDVLYLYQPCASRFESKLSRESQGLLGSIKGPFVCVGKDSFEVLYLCEPRTSRFGSKINELFWVSSGLFESVSGSFVCVRKCSSVCGRINGLARVSQQLFCRYEGLF